MSRERPSSRPPAPRNPGRAPARGAGHPARAALAALALAFALLPAGCRSRSPALIGLAGPLRDPAGAPMRRAAELAVDEINAGGGVGGRPLALVERDDFGNPDSATAVAAAFYRSRVSAVVGHLFASQSAAASAVYGAGPRPLVAISPSSCGPEAGRLGPSTFRLCPSDATQGAALAQWARRRSFQRGAVLYLNDEYGRAVRQGFVQEFERLGGELVAIDPYLDADPEVGPYLDRLAARPGAQFLLVAGRRTDAERILREVRRRGVTVPVLGSRGLEGIEQAGPVAEGVYLSQPYLPSLGSAANRRFVEAYRRRYPTAEPPNQTAAATYDAVRLLAAAIARAGTDRAAVRRALREIGTATPPFEGATGRVWFDPTGGLHAAQVSVAVVRGGVLRPADEP